MNLESVFEAARDRVSWPHFESLCRSGVRGDALFLNCDFAFGISEVATHNGRWVEKFPGQEVIIIPLHSPSGRLVDLIAFKLETPRSYWPAIGGQSLLGAENIERAAYDKTPLMVHESPLDWLKAGYEGVVILDWQTYWPLWFGDAPALRCMDEKFGRRLQNLLQRPFQIPEVQVAA